MYMEKGRDAAGWRVDALERMAGYPGDRSTVDFGSHIWLNTYVPNFDIYGEKYKVRNQHE